MTEETNKIALIIDTVQTSWISTHYIVKLFQTAVINV